MTSAQTLTDRYCETLGCCPTWIEELPEHLLANTFHATALIAYCTKMHITIDRVPYRIRNLSIACLYAEIEHAVMETETSLNLQPA